MTQEDKQLLLADLCARLPYGVICNDNRHGSGRVTYIDITPDDIEQKNGKVVVYYFDFDECGELENCKPYLRPMSSIASLISAKDWSSLGGIELIDFYNSNHIDYRGFIEKGLALEAPEEMYGREEQNEKSRANRASGK